MQVELIGILETMTIALSGFLIKKYVFLEPDMERKKQHISDIICFFLVICTFFVFGKDVASIIVLILIALNICIAREKQRLQGLFLMIPFLGIINGLLIPIMVIPPYLLNLSVEEAMIFQLLTYAILFMLLGLFYVKGKDWRKWFNENMKHRSLRKSEQYLLWMIGILMLFFSNAKVIRIVADRNNQLILNSVYGREINFFICISSIAALIMTITIIVLIMQGNKRSFYHKQVSHMQTGMISFMAEVVENRDDNTGGHIKRTAKYVECIANELKRQSVYNDILTEKYLRNMIIAAPLHDIGKIHIPDQVLNKPGRLTDEEFEIMKTHCLAGEELLVQAIEEIGVSEYLNMALEMALYHHEWWNGQGYPYGISGEEIPLCARIMAVADVFDALTSKRCYKQAMPFEKACAIIQEESGTHFDPLVTKAFFMTIKDIEKIE